MSLVFYVVGIVGFIAWIYLLYVLDRAQVPAWRYIAGSGGLFVFMMAYLRPVLTQPLASLVAACAGLFGSITGIFTSFFKYGVIFISSRAGQISLQIDFECSGVLEIMAFISLLAFFRAYSSFERVVVGIIGSVLLLLFNVIRIITISLIIYQFGTKSFYVAHTLIGRLVFYGLSVMLYFVVFTKTQIVRQKVGNFTYGHSE